ncbi:MAG: glycosyltransferase family 39 protein [Kiritimatiellae bacterium]|nr:glycosyltransferase family 39 protein [Kiritimatiellia bacterium]
MTRKLPTAHSLFLPIGLAVAVQLLTALATPCVPMNDSIWYLAQTMRYPFATPVDFYSLTQPPASWDVHFPPGLPLLFDLFMLLFRRYWVVVFIAAQHGCRLLTVWSIARCGALLGHPRRGWWAALLYAVHFRSALYCQALLSEPAFTALIATALWACCAALHSGKRAYWQYGGLLFAAASLVRFQAVIPLAAAAAVLLLPRTGQIRQRAWSAALAVLAPSVVALGFTVLWNGVRFDRWTVSDFRGRHLFDRAFLQAHFTAPGSPAYRELRAFGNPAGAPEHERSLHGVYWYDIYPRLRAAGLSARQADRLMERAAFAALARHPIQYAWTVLTDLFRSEPGWTMGPDVFIPDWIWRAARRPPVEENPWLIPGRAVGSHAESLARKVLFVHYAVPDALPLPARFRAAVQELLLALPAWNGVWIFAVLGGSLLLVDRAQRRAIALFALPFWASLVFSVAVQGPVPRFYTALVPLALWLGLAAIERLGGAIQRHAAGNGPAQPGARDAPASP